MTEPLEANRDAGLAQTGKINIGMVNGFDPSSLGRLDPARAAVEAPRASGEADADVQQEWRQLARGGLVSG